MVTFRKRHGSTKGFTLIEVLAACLVLSLAFISTMSCLSTAFQMLDTARNITLASQIAESQIEDFRLKSWAQLSTYATGTSVAINVGTAMAGSFSSADAAAISGRFSATRTITDVRTDLKRIVIAINWNDSNGRPHTRSYETLLGHNGLSDFFVVYHAP
jgi:prepilin-type N-terminal cleavage/methylation domain-containing protein